MQDLNGDEDTDASGVPPRRRGRTSTAAPAVIRTGRETLSVEMALTLFRHMVRTRALEERSIKMSKSGEAFFWIGGPGEEAFNVCLGLQIHKGRGPAFDYLHLHYRNAGIMLAMGMPMIDHTRQLAMRWTDRHSKGRNFVGHYCIPEWNVVPVTSVIEVQYSMAPGTALVQKRHGGEGITVVVGGEAGSAEGDFETCLNWSTRPGQELPVLMIVTNNNWGISTAMNEVHTNHSIAERAVPFGMRAEVVDGNDPIATWHAIDRAMRYCRRERKPFLLEAKVSRLHGHSSSSGAQRNWAEVDVIAQFEQQLIDAGAIDAAGVKAMRAEAKAEADDAVVRTMAEDQPTREDVEAFTYAPSGVDAIYPDDYTGLPGKR